jgi:Domain of Unknown Function (DUF1259)
MTARLRFFTLLCVLSLPNLLRAQGVTTTPIDQILGRPGQKTGDVYRVSFPRTDLHVSIDGLAIKPGLALGSWAAFLGTDDNAMVMGDLVLLEEEVNPVMAKLRSYHVEITAVHNHLMGGNSKGALCTLNGARFSIATGYIAAHGSSGFEDSARKTCRRCRGTSAACLGENRRGRGRTQRHV